MQKTEHRYPIIQHDFDCQDTYPISAPGNLLLWERTVKTIAWLVWPHGGQVADLEITDPQITAQHAKHWRLIPWPGHVIQFDHPVHVLCRTAYDRPLLIEWFTQVFAANELDYRGISVSHPHQWQPICRDTTLEHNQGDPGAWVELGIYRPRAHGVLRLRAKKDKPEIVEYAVLSFCAAIPNVFDIAQSVDDGADYYEVTWDKRNMAGDLEYSPFLYAGERYIIRARLTDSNQNVSISLDAGTEYEGGF